MCIKSRFYEANNHNYINAFCRVSELKQWSSQLPIICSHSSTLQQGAFLSKSTFVSWTYNRERTDRRLNGLHMNLCLLSTQINSKSTELSLSLSALKNYEKKEIYQGSKFFIDTIQFSFHWWNLEEENDLSRRKFADGEYLLREKSAGSSLK